MRSSNWLSTVEAKRITSCRISETSRENQAQKVEERQWLPQTLPATWTLSNTTATVNNLHNSKILLNLFPILSPRQDHPITCSARYRRERGYLVSHTRRKSPVSQQASRRRDPQIKKGHQQMLDIQKVLMSTMEGNSGLEVRCPNFQFYLFSTTLFLTFLVCGFFKIMRYFYLSEYNLITHWIFGAVTTALIERMLYYIVFGTDNCTAPGIKSPVQLTCQTAPLSPSDSLLCLVELCPSIKCRSTDSFDDSILPLISPLGWSTQGPIIIF